MKITSDNYHRLYELKSPLLCDRIVQKDKLYIDWKYCLVKKQVTVGNLNSRLRDIAFICAGEGYTVFWLCLKYIK